MLLTFSAEGPNGLQNRRDSDEEEETPEATADRPKRQKRPSQYDSDSEDDGKQVADQLSLAL